MTTTPHTPLATAEPGSGACDGERVRQGEGRGPTARWAPRARRSWCAWRRARSGRSNVPRKIHDAEGRDGDRDDPERDPTRELRLLWAMSRKAKNEATSDSGGNSAHVTEGIALREQILMRGIGTLGWGREVEGVLLLPVLRVLPPGIRPSARPAPRSWRPRVRAAVAFEASTSAGGRGVLRRGDLLRRGLRRVGRRGLRPGPLR